MRKIKRTVISPSPHLPLPHPAHALPPSTWVLNRFPFRQTPLTHLVGFVAPQSPQPRWLPLVAQQAKQGSEETILGEATAKLLLRSLTHPSAPPKVLGIII